MYMQFTYTPKAKDPVIALKNGGFCINPLNKEVTQNMIKNMRECASLEIKSKKRKLQEECN